MALAKSALAVVAALLRGHVRGAAICVGRAGPDAGGHRLEAAGARPGRRPAEDAALYAPLQEKEPYHGVRIERDVKYGATDRNLLDVFMPETASSPRPVLIFIHGGAFVGRQQAHAGQPVL